jgi:glycine/serine hydroxymethyltransferase
MSDQPFSQSLLIRYPALEAIAYEVETNTELISYEEREVEVDNWKPQNIVVGV